MTTPVNKNTLNQSSTHLSNSQIDKNSNDKQKPEGQNEASQNPLKTKRKNKQYWDKSKTNYPYTRKDAYE